MINFSRYIAETSSNSTAKLAQLLTRYRTVMSKIYTHTLNTDERNVQKAVEYAILDKMNEFKGWAKASGEEIALLTLADDIDYTESKARKIPTLETETKTTVKQKPETFIKYTITGTFGVCEAYVSNNVKHPTSDVLAAVAHETSSVSSENKRMLIAKTPIKKLPETAFQSRRYEGVWIGSIRAMSQSVDKVLHQGTMVITSSTSSIVRNELKQGVKDGVLGRLEKDDLKPEIFFVKKYESQARAIQADIAVERRERLAKRGIFNYHAR